MSVEPVLFPVTETFRSLQGEGNFAGRRALFLRFHFCNLTCAWCDSKYTWHAKSAPFKEHAAEEIRSWIAAEDAPRHVILTGGEPSLHPLDRLAVADRSFHVETNGTLIPTEPADLVLPDGTRRVRPPMDEAVIGGWNWVVSPKSGNAGQRLREDALRWWSRRAYAVFKFVVRPGVPADLDEVIGLTRRFDLDPDKVWVALEGVTPESQRRGDAVEAILDAGFHHSPRLHVTLWGDQRGR